MTDKAQYQSEFDALKVCVLIPTYNNSGTIADVIEGVSAYTHNIIVVNDGSTDNTESLLKQFPNITVHSYSPNRGKGNALRTGFKVAVENGYDYAITIDSDGQHYPKDLPTFLEKIKAEPGSLIIGARNMDQSSVPGKSSFGNKFSNFWFKVETGITVPDTQSGYRLYPVKQLSSMRFFTVKYEFEIEVIVRAAWAGIPVTSVPVLVYYPPQEERVSHFRPFKDFSRISVLNTVLVTILILYIKPRDIFRSFQKKNFKEILFDPNESLKTKVFSIAFGVFMGIVPLWGFQMIIAVAVCIWLKLNKFLVLTSAQVSLPPFIPIIIFLSFEMGKIGMGDKAVSFASHKGLSLDNIHINITQYLIGSIILAVTAAAVAAFVSFTILKLTSAKNK